MRPSDEQGELPLAPGSILEHSGGSTFIFSHSANELYNDSPEDQLVLAAVATEEWEREAQVVCCIHAPDGPCPYCEARKNAARWKQWGRKGGSDADSSPKDS